MFCGNPSLTKADTAFAQTARLGGFYFLH